MSPKFLSKPSATTLLSGSLLAGSLILGPTANAALSFVFDYSQNAAGVGFDDPTSGAQRRAALDAAASQFSAMFGGHFTQSATITMNATSTDSPFPSNLASAGSYLSGLPGFGTGEIIRNKAISGTDLNGAAEDGFVDINWGYDWELDYNTPVSSTKFDLYGVLFHEFTHAMGFESYINQDGTDPFGNGNSNTGTVGSWTKYDQFLTDGSGVPLIDPITGMTNQTIYDGAVTTLVVFESPEAGSVKLYTPNPYEAGGSVRHLDATGTNAVAMMKNGFDTGPLPRDYNADEIHILTSIGYTVVPEPNSIALVMVACGTAALSRRRKV